MTGPSAAVELGEDRVLRVHLDDDVVVLDVPTEWEERLTREQAWLLMDGLDLVATWGPGASTTTTYERPSRASDPYRSIPKTTSVRLAEPATPGRR